MHIEFDKKIEGHRLFVKEEELSNRCFICGKELETPFLLCESLKLGLHTYCEERSRCIGDLKNNHKHIRIVEVKKR